MNSSEIRSRFLKFFEKRWHTIIPSASLVTADEKGITDSTLFNTAGMQPLVPYLLGKSFIKDGKEVKRLADVQKCLRTVDIDDIGDKTHATFFEMLGNWSLGDYFKKEAINWSYEFLTSKEEGLGLDPRRLYVTVFEGDENAPRDDEAAGIWRGVFKSDLTPTLSSNEERENATSRIFFMPASSNWWEAGANGPCGPDTEMYYDIGNMFGGKPITKSQFLEADAKRQVIEVWNDVFMQYEKKDGKIVGKLPKPSVDTGAGLERLAMTLQGVDNIYDTDLLKPVFKVAKNLADSERSQRIIADHVRASVFLIADGVTPSNTDRGYVLRRLIRKAIFHTSAQKVNDETVSSLVDAVLGIYKQIYADLVGKSALIKRIINEEALKFTKTLEQGTREFEKIAGNNISGSDALKLFTSYGLPIDMIVELAKIKNMSVDIKGYEDEFKKHQELSRTGAEKKFKGGLEDATNQMVVRYHTATHLLHQALHDVLGENVMQKGSNITAERLRFDFAHGAKMTEEEKKKVEDIVNQKIQEGLLMNKVVMSKSEAEKTGARHFFGDKYGDEVSIYFIGNDLKTAYSKEFCGGPHVANTRELAGPEGKWKFKIQKEEAVAQGIRRIKAVLLK